MKKIVLPKPCSEDWNEMTKTEKGSFCGKCAFEVIDFTTQTNEEVRSTLLANAGKKTCGHISQHQLDTINSDYHLWENQSVVTLKSKFLYACVMVFGLTLFSGCEYLIPEEERPVGMMDYVVEGEMAIEDDSLSTCTKDYLDTIADCTVDGELGISED